MTIVAAQDPALRATLERCEPLVYSARAPAELDRPDHVRAASAIAAVGKHLLIVQDDASFIALWSPDGTVTAIALPVGAGGRRRFEERLGNKGDKLDLEAAVVVEGAHGLRLVAFGSGSTLRRDRIAVVDLAVEGGRNPRVVNVELVDAAGWYAELRAQTAFSGSELNVEGSVVDEDRLILFQRGNGAPRRGLLPVNATGELPLGAFAAWLAAGGSGPPPELRDVKQYDLGRAGDVPFTFTDAARLGPERVVFVASAEASPDTFRDGPVLGTRIGLLAGGPPRFTTLLDSSGRPSTRKVEGVCPCSERDDRLWVVTDADRPDRPAELCEVALSGPWR